MAAGKNAAVPVSFYNTNEEWESFSTKPGLKSI
jgi:hypothetical protein